MTRPVVGDALGRSVGVEVELTVGTMVGTT